MPRKRFHGIRVSGDLFPPLLPTLAQRAIFRPGAQLRSIQPMGRPDAHPGDCCGRQLPGNWR